MGDAVVVEDGPGWALWRTGSGTWLEVADDLAGVLPDGAVVGVVGSAWPRGRWAFTFRGDPLPYEAPMPVRSDPLLTCAMTVLAAAKQAKNRSATLVRATFGEVTSYEAAPGLTAERASAVLDVRAPSEADRDALVDAVVAQAQARAERDRTQVDVEAEEVHGALVFDEVVTEVLVAALGAVAVSSPGAGRAAACAGRGERAAAIVLRERDPAVVAAALAALA